MMVELKTSTMEGWEEMARACRGAGAGEGIGRVVQIPEHKTGTSALVSAAATGRKCKLANRQSNSPDSKKLENGGMKTVCTFHWRELFSRQQFSSAERPLAQQG